MSNKIIIAERPTKNIYRDGDMLIKQFDETYSKANILNEALNQARVEETDLNIPRLHAVNVVDGKWSLFYDYIEGKTLEQLMSEHPEKEDEYLELFVDLQMTVLSKKVPLLTKLKEKLNGRISIADLDATTRYELHTRLECMPKHRNLCQGDFNPSNIIITEDGKAYIVDWSHATQGNSSADVATSYLLFYLRGQKDLAEKYLKLYCKKSDTAKQYIQKWIPIVAASRLTKAKEEEHDFLMSWCDVVD